MNINITKRIHINPQSKDSLGKSFEAEFRTAWLDYHGVQWNGSDLDDRHHSFTDRHPAKVEPYKLGSDDESKSTLLGLFRNVSRNDASVPDSMICRRSSRQCIARLIRLRSTLHPPPGSGSFASRIPRWRIACPNCKPHRTFLKVMCAKIFSKPSIFRHHDRSFQNHLKIVASRMMETLLTAFAACDQPKLKLAGADEIRAAVQHAALVGEHGGLSRTGDKLQAKG